MLARNRNSAEGFWAGRRARVDCLELGLHVRGFMHWGSAWRNVHLSCYRCMSSLCKAAIVTVAIRDAPIV